MPLVPPYIQALVPYQAGKTPDQLRQEYHLDKIIKLASNENPLGPSPIALKRMQEVFPELHLYPQGGLKLRKVLAKRFNVKLENTVVGAGSEGIMSNIIRAFLLDDEEVLTAEGTFIGFYVLARSRGVKLVTVPLKDYHYDLERIADAITEKTKIIYLANPNNPTGTMFSRKEFEKFMERVPFRVLVILDEAYFEYAKGGPNFPDSMTYRLDNVITLRTFSKAYGLAGVRIGYGFAHEELCLNVNKVKLPFEPSVLGEAAGLGALEDEEFLNQTLKVYDEGRAYLSEQFARMKLHVAPSVANFFMAIFSNEEEALTIFDKLQKQGVIVRPLRAFGLPHCLRMTIGNREENEMLVNALYSTLN